MLPTSGSKHPYDIVDEAIAVIKEAGVPYKVCPFETVIEAPYDVAMDIAKKVQEACYEAGADKLMCYMKIQSAAADNVTIQDKMEKYG
ncbi:MAG: thiamine-binding protein [Thermodesulfobacteriota bacterium]|nr:thiamine-binding protein [Thermodesulfobacteriota bacterium]